MHLPLDAIDDSGFWDDWVHGPQFATPLYYRAHLQRFPERSARVLAAIAGGAAGPWLTGALYDVTGSYTLAFWAAIGCSVLSAVAIWLAAPRQVRAVAGSVP